MHGLKEDISSLFEPVRGPQEVQTMQCDAETAPQVCLGCGAGKSCGCPSSMPYGTQAQWAAILLGRQENQSKSARRIAAESEQPISPSTIDRSLKNGTPASSGATASKLGLDGKHYPPKRAAADAELAFPRTAEGRRLREEKIKDEAVAAVALNKGEQRKLAQALKRQIKQQEAEFDARVMAECQKRYVEMMLPEHTEALAGARAIINAYKPPLTGAQFLTIASCLKDVDVGQERREAAFKLLWPLRFLLSGGK